MSLQRLSGGLLPVLKRCVTWGHSISNSVPAAACTASLRSANVSQANAWSPPSTWAFVGRGFAGEASGGVSLDEMVQARAAQLQKPMRLSRMPQWWVTRKPRNTVYVTRPPASEAPVEAAARALPDRSSPHFLQKLRAATKPVNSGRNQFARMWKKQRQIALNAQRRKVETSAAVQQLALARQRRWRAAVEMRQGESGATLEIS